MPPNPATKTRKRKAGAKGKAKAVPPLPTKDELFHQAFYDDSSSDEASRSSETKHKLETFLTARGELKKARGRKPKRPRLEAPTPHVVPGLKRHTTYENKSNDTDPDVCGNLVLDADRLHLKIDLSHLLAQRKLPIEQLLSDSGYQLATINTTGMSQTISRYAGFLDLPPELRCKIYCLSLVQPDRTINITQRNNFSRMGQLLRVSRQVYQEAREILYRENSFHFSRANSQRAEYFEPLTEIGYEDIYKFLQDIGPHNIANLRYVSIEFDDALPSNTKYLNDHAQRKYVTDFFVVEILKMLGKDVVLDKFVVGFRGAASINAKDYHFLKALCSIRCREFVCDSTLTNRLTPETMMVVRGLVELKEERNTEVNWARKKRVIPRMWHDDFHF